MFTPLLLTPTLAALVALGAAQPTSIPTPKTDEKKIAEVGIVS